MLPTAALHSQYRFCALALWWFRNFLFRRTLLHHAAVDLQWGALSVSTKRLASRPDERLLLSTGNLLLVNEVFIFFSHPEMQKWPSNWFPSLIFITKSGFYEPLISLKRWSCWYLSTSFSCQAPAFCPTTRSWMHVRWLTKLWPQTSI